MKEIKEILKSPFKPLQVRKYLGKKRYGTPYFDPIGFNPTIISFRKLKLTPQEELDKLPNALLQDAKKFRNLPMVRRCNDKIFQIFGHWFWISWGWPIAYDETGLGWKDKYESPRFEWSPSKKWYFFKWQYCIFYNAPVKDDDRYWEMYLWWRYYTPDRDINEARKTWPWSSGGKSTWDDNNLK